MAGDLGTLRGTLELDSSGLIQSSDQAISELKDLNTQLGSTENSSKAASDSFRGVGESMRRVDAAAQAAAFKEISGQLGKISADLQESAGRSDDLRDSLNGAFGENSDAIAGFIEQIGTAQGVIDNEKLKQASLTLQNLGAFSQQNLQLLADVSVKTGKSVDGLADSFGKFEKFQDAKTFKALTRELGFSRQELEVLGVQFTEKGLLAVDLAGNVDLARQAIQQLSQEKFGGSLAAVSDDSAKLKGELELLKQELGASQFAFTEWIASGVLPAVQGLRALPPEIKGAAGALVGLSSQFGSTILYGAQLAANLKTIGLSGAALSGYFTSFRTAGVAAFTALNIPVGVALNNLRLYIAAQVRSTALSIRAGVANFSLAGTYASLSTSVASSTAAISGAGLAFAAIPAAVSVAVIAFTELEKQVTAANEALLKSDDLRSKGVKDVQGNVKFSTSDILNRNIKDLQKEGLTVNTINQRILDQMRGANDLQEQGNTEGSKRALERVKRLKDIRLELAANIAKEQEAEKAAQAAEKTKSKKTKSEKLPSGTGLLAGARESDKANTDFQKEQDRAAKEQKREQDRQIKEQARLAREQQREQDRVQKEAKRKSDQDAREKKKSEQEKSKAAKKDTEDFLDRLLGPDDIGTKVKDQVKKGVSEGISEGAKEAKPFQFQTDITGGVLSMDQFFASQKAAFSLDSPFQSRLTNPTASKPQSAIEKLAERPVSVPLVINIDGKKVSSKTITSESSSSQFNQNFILGEA